MRKHLLIYPILAGLLILLIAMPATAAQFAPAVFAIDQDVVDGTVAVTRVTTNAPGWIVIHADDGGNPGVVLGQAAVPTGISADVVVEIDTSGVTDTLWAMLHSDEGVVGEYEFPGADTPVLNNDEIVMDSFAVGEVAQSIVGIASSTEGFSTLVQAVEAAGLVETLRGDGPFTVFAPTDDAFAAVPPETLDALLADPEQLTQVLLYHVVPGAIVAADLSDGMEAETAQGDSVTITISDGNVMVNDANVTATDIMAHNGVIHVIDQVLLPPAPEEEVVEAAAADEAATEETATEEAATEDTEATEAAPEEAAAEATPTPEEETMVDEAMAETPSVTVIDQGSNGSNVAVLQAVAAQAGWMVIHADNDGAPGAVLGQTGLPAGTTDNIIVTLNEPISGETKLWAMLHVDEGEAGVYEFPGPDGPVLVDDAIVMAPFTAIVTGDEAMA
ncbi:MAG: fasciclin domain-containing protein, partial [Caldilineaceae bacterium]